MLRSAVRSRLAPPNSRGSIFRYCLCYWLRFRTADLLSHKHHLPSKSIRYRAVTIRVLPIAPSASKSLLSPVTRYCARPAAAMASTGLSSGSGDNSTVGNVSSTVACWRNPLTRLPASAGLIYRRNFGYLEARRNSSSCQVEVMSSNRLLRQA